MDRSPTAEDLLQGRKGYEVLSAGTWEHARRPITKELVDWADRIFVMEHEQAEAILALEPSASAKMDVLNIPDIYSRNHPKLVKMLKTRLSKRLQIDWDI
jgi:predicted protein tyrosine phosphatase